MFKPLIPIITDVWEHQFNEIEHIATVHEKYGSHHVEKESADNNSNDDNHRGSNTLKSEDQVLFHILEDGYKNAFILNAFEKQFVPLRHSKLASILMDWDGPPPKFI